MKTTIGKKGLNYTWQTPFPETTKCIHCDGVARIGFVSHEGQAPNDQWNKNKEYVCDLHENDPNDTGFWLHDACCVAVYFCEKCLNATALYNQA